MDVNLNVNVDLDADADGEFDSVSVYDHVQVHDRKPWRNFGRAALSPDGVENRRSQPPRRRGRQPIKITLARFSPWRFVLPFSSGSAVSEMDAA